MKKPYCVIIPFGNLHNAQEILRIGMEKYNLVGWIEEIDPPQSIYNKYLKSPQITQDEFRRFKK